MKKLLLFLSLVMLSGSSSFAMDSTQDPKFKEAAQIIVKVNNKSELCHIRSYLAAKKESDQARFLQYIINLRPTKDMSEFVRKLQTQNLQKMRTLRDTIDAWRKQKDFIKVRDLLDNVDTMLEGKGWGVCK